MTRQHHFFIFLCSLVFCFAAQAQDDIIRLKNPSFEDIPKAGKAPAGWYNCGFPGETPPDVQPDPTFLVSKQAYDRGTYMGMVVRDNDTWEKVGQRLSKPIQANTCYNFSIYLCRSQLYRSRSQLTQEIANYVTPTKLIIWGGDEYCAKKERLGESRVVRSFEWTQHDFKFEPQQTHQYILFEAFYETPILFPYNGNILLDNASAIIPTPCDENVLAEVKKPVVQFIVPGTKSMKVDDRGITVQAQVKNVSPNLNISFMVNGKANTDFDFNPDTGTFQADLRKFKIGENIIRVMASNSAGRSQDRATLVYEAPEVIADVPVNVPPTRTQPKPSTPVPPKTTSTTKPKPAEQPAEDKVIEGVARKDMKAGQTIQLNKLYFGINETAISDNSHEALDEIYDFLKYNKDVSIEIGGHTNGNCDDKYCDSLSEKRAKSVADYLEKKGIEKDRLSYKGYGKRKPIASNKTPVGRKKNQRVEIKILSMNG